MHLPSLAAPPLHPFAEGDAPSTGSEHRGALRAGSALAANAAVTAARSRCVTRDPLASRVRWDFPHGFDGLLLPGPPVRRLRFPKIPPCRPEFPMSKPLPERRRRWPRALPVVQRRPWSVRRLP